MVRGKLSSTAYYFRGAKWITSVTYKTGSKGAHLSELDLYGYVLIVESKLMLATVSVRKGISLWALQGKEPEYAKLHILYWSNVLIEIVKVKSLQFIVMLLTGKSLAMPLLQRKDMST